ncbi:S8 family serine peptidase [Ferrimicrobium sp.]|uniref:S8 family serine peptidase n=1 Tax=Ferrimicrobium sp. TaxID=2926050 RepID=UPI002636F595|nr:S8 family serine peptidase [Ferrimicrobium sp.]
MAAERDRLHIILRGFAAPEPYRRPPRAIPGTRIPTPANRGQHGRQLQSALEQAGAAGLARRESEAVRVAGALDGIYVRFESFPDLDLALESLDPHRGRVHPELRAVRQVTIDGQTFEQAVVFVPDGQLGYFLGQVEAYLASADSDKPRNYNLIDRIQSIGLASLEELWTDPKAEFPVGDDAVWWEVWLRRRDGHEFERLKQFAEAAGAGVGVQTLGFSDRLVVLVRASRTQLSRAINVLDDVAELRRPKESAGLIALDPAVEQADWVDQLATRTTAAPPTAPAACVVDTGVYQAHPLFNGSLLSTDCHTCDPEWGLGVRHGHGTEMAGPALYGDMGSAMASGDPIHLRHRLESVKIMQRPSENLPHLWGALTAAATSRVEIQAPTRRRAFGMAVSAGRDAVGDLHAERIMVGQPTSWSATVDALAAGLAIDVTEEGMVFLGEGTTSFPSGRRQRRHV